MLSPLDLYHSPTAASSRIASRASPSAPLRLAIRPSPSPSSRVLPSQSPSTIPKAVKRSSPVLSTPIVERASPSGSQKAAAGPSGPRRKLKHSRAAQACDVCRRNHRKCDGPVDGSDSCGRCIAQHKKCTWNFSKERFARQRSASISPQTRRISIKRSRSTPTQSEQYAPPSPSSDHASPSPSPSSPSCTSESPSPPDTPSDRPQPLRLPLLDHAQPASSVGAEFTCRPPMQWEAPPSPPKAEAPVPVRQVLPDFHAECAAMANKYDLLIYALPLNPWEDSTQREKSMISGKSLYCTTPGWVNPPPSRKEAAEILRALLEVESESESDSEYEVTSFTARPVAGDCPELSDAEEESSDDEPLISSRVASNHITDDETDVESIADPAPASDDMDMDIEMEDDTSSDTEPDFCFPQPGSSQFDSQLPLQHAQQQVMRDRFDPFLFTPCHCFSTPPRASPSTPASSIPHSNSYGRDMEEKKDSDTFWDEGMPDVLQDASKEEALEECLQFLAA